MTQALRRYVHFGAIALAMMAVLGGCNAVKPSPIVVVVTNAPTPTPTMAATPTMGASATASVIPTVTAPAAATEGIDACTTATADQKALFSEAASKLSFQVYCGSLPSKWWFNFGAWGQPDGGHAIITYKSAGSGVLLVGEGNFCPVQVDPSSCWNSTGDLGSAYFGQLAGTLHTRSVLPQWNHPSATPVSASGTIYAVYVDSGTTHGYQIVGQGMSQSEFVACAALMVRVFKP